MKPVLLSNPNGVTAGFDVHLYCKYKSDRHAWDEFPHQICEPTETQSRKAIKRAGWVWHRDNTATCPKCAKDLGLR